MTTSDDSEKLPSMAGSWARIGNTDEWGVSLPSGAYRPGDVVTVVRKDGTEKDVKLVERLEGGRNWSKWRVSLDVSPAPVRRAAAAPVVVRRKGGNVKLLTPVLSPEPPPHTDADAPPPPGLMGAEPGSEDDDAEQFMRECREDEHNFRD